MTGSPQPKEQLTDWVHRLASLRQEIEIATGDPEPGIYESKLSSLVRFAHEEACDELKSHA